LRRKCFVFVLLLPSVRGAQGERRDVKAAVFCVWYTNAALPASGEAGSQRTAPAAAVPRCCRW
uniref:Uncharacterized protein n=1 Tax=Serinus canaria TaxID=9135 RepID=A0A8C9MEE3_SERCA